MVKLTYEANSTIQMHYADFNQFTDKTTTVVKQMCAKLLEEKVKQSRNSSDCAPEQTELWIYRNEDVDYKYLPDVIYNIKEGAINSSCRYLQRNLHY